MNDSTVNGSALHWKQLIIPVLACCAIAYSTRSCTDDFSSYLLLSAIPLALYLLIAQSYALLGILIFVVPLSVPYTLKGGYVVGLPSELILAIFTGYLLVISAMRSVFTRQLLRHPLVILLFAELSWMLICSFFSNDPGTGYKRVFMRALFLVVFLLFAAKTYLDKGPRYHQPFILYGVGLIWPVINAIRFHARFNFSQSSVYRMCEPFFTDHTIYGACIAFVLPALLIMTFGNRALRLRGFYRAPTALLTIFLIAAEFLSYSRAAWISIIVAGVFGLLLVFRVRLISIMVFLGIAGAVTWYYREELYRTISSNEAVSTTGDVSEHLLSATNVQSDASNTERINRWLCAWRMAEERPLVGFGPGMYQFEYGRFQERGYMTRISTFSGNKGHAHSEYFTPLSETGFPGFILFLTIVFSVIGYGMRVIYRETNRQLKLLLFGAVLGLITFYVHGIFNAFLDTDKMAVLVFGSIAVIVAADIRQRRENTVGKPE